jgi:hypothetical protein
MTQDRTRENRESQKPQSKPDQSDRAGVCGLPLAFGSLRSRSMMGDRDDRGAEGGRGRTGGRHGDRSSGDHARARRTTGFGRATGPGRRCRAAAVAVGAAADQHQGQQAGGHAKSATSHGPLLSSGFAPVRQGNTYPTVRPRRPAINAFRGPRPPFPPPPGKPCRLGRSALSRGLRRSGRKEWLEEVCGQITRPAAPVTPGSAGWGAGFATQTCAA